MQRIRIEFSKAGEFQYTSNLDLMKASERMFRRAGIPVVYTQGFHPQPKMNIASPLPLGWQGEHELLDVWLADGQATDVIQDALVAAAPPGLDFLYVTEIDLQAPPIQTMVRSLEYKVIIPDGHDLSSIQNKIEQLMSCNSILRTRRGKSYDLRPLLIKVEIIQEPENSLYYLRINVRSNSDATGRPDEVMAEMGLDPLSAIIIRTKIILTDGEPE